jgi:hypothetical protein
MTTSNQPAHYVLEPDEPMDLWEWFCYVKPIGPSLRISIRQGSEEGFSASTSGTEPRFSEAPSPHIQTEKRNDEKRNQDISPSFGIRDVRPGAAEV